MVDRNGCQALACSTADENSASTGRVLVVAARSTDSDILCQLLVDTGYRPQRCSDLTTLKALLSQREPLDDVIATVLCHQIRLNNPDSEATQINRPAHLPDQLLGKRLIVVSDCVAENTIVSLLEEGAHQCFDMHEPSRVLQVRLEAALRRHGRLMKRQLTQGDIRFDLKKRRVTRGGTVIDLSPKEFELAYYLFSNRGRVVENSELMTSIWSLPSSMDTRRIDTAACRVRKKLRLAETHGWQLKRLRCVGYWLVNAAGA